MRQWRGTCIQRSGDWALWADRAVRTDRQIPPYGNNLYIIIYEKSSLTLSSLHRRKHVCVIYQVWRRLHVFISSPKTISPELYPNLNHITTSSFETTFSTLWSFSYLLKFSVFFWVWQRAAAETLPLYQTHSAALSRSRRLQYNVVCLDWVILFHLPFKVETSLVRGLQVYAESNQPDINC